MTQKSNFKNRLTLPESYDMVCVHGKHDSAEVARMYQWLINNADFKDEASGQYIFRLPQANHYQGVFLQKVSDAKLPSPIYSVFDEALDREHSFLLINATVPKEEVPKFRHDCAACIFLGRYTFQSPRHTGGSLYVPADLYVCQPDRPMDATLIVRHSDERQEYASFLASLLIRNHEALSTRPTSFSRGLLEGLKRACQKSLTGTFMRILFDQENASALFDRLLTEEPPVSKPRA